MAALHTAFDPAAATTQPAAASTSTSTDPSSFASTLAQVQGAGSTSSTAATPATGGAALSPTAAGMLTTDQQAFGARLAAQTGLNPQVIAAWMLAEESSGAAKSRQSSNNNDWLNIGYTGSATYGATDSIWGNPITAADATAGWIKGQDTIPGYGKASSGIQAILTSVGQPADAQIAALQTSGWAGSGYSSLPALLQQVGGG